MLLLTTTCRRVVHTHKLNREVAQERSLLFTTISVVFRRKKSDLAKVPTEIVGRTTEGGWTPTNHFVRTGHGIPATAYGAGLYSGKQPHLQQYLRKISQIISFEGTPQDPRVQDRLKIFVCKIASSSLFRGPPQVPHLQDRLKFLI